MTGAVKVLVTGGSGFLGRAIVHGLEAAGAEVIAPRSREMDLHDAASIARVLDARRPTALVHSAAYYGGLGITMREPMKVFWYNVMMTANLFKALADYDGLEKSVVIGSACAYPGDVDGDMPESAFWDGPLHASVQAYGFTKKTNLVGQDALKTQKGTAWAHPVITNLYGPHDVFTEYRSHVAAALIKKFADAHLSGRNEVVLWGTGSPMREFIYVEDAAEAVARCTLTDFTGVVNIGTGVGTSIRELAETIRRLVGFKGDIVWDADKPDGVMRKVLDVSRMKTDLGFTPAHDLESGLKKTIDWYMANKEDADLRP